MSVIYRSGSCMGLRFLNKRVDGQSEPKCTSTGLLFPLCKCKDISSEGHLSWEVRTGQLGKLYFLLVSSRYIILSYRVNMGGGGRFFNRCYYLPTPILQGVYIYIYVEVGHIFTEYFLG